MVSSQNVYKQTTLGQHQRRQTETSTNLNMDKPTIRHTETSTTQNVDKRRRYTTKCVPLLVFDNNMYQYVLKLDIAFLYKYQSTIYIIFIQIKSIIGRSLVTFYWTHKIVPT